MTFSALSLLLCVAPAFSSGGTALPPQLSRSPARLDTASPGLEIAQHVAVAPFAQIGSIDADTVVVFDGSTIARFELATGGSTTVATLPGFVFPSFVVVEPDHGHALIGESQNNDILRVDLASGAVATVVNLNFNFAAVIEDAGHALVSAAVLGLGHPNQILRVDLASGATTQVADVTGYSGPLARAANGDLYYGQPLPQPATQNVLRWTKAQVESGLLLTENDATVFASGFDSVSSLAIDPATHHVFVAESRFGATSEIEEYAPDGSFVASLLAAPNWIAGLEVLADVGPGSFQSFQPSGTLLRYQTSDFFSSADCATLRPRQATASVSGSGLGGPGDVTLSIAGAYPNASVFVVRAPSWAYAFPEVALPFGNFLLHTGLPLSYFQGGGVWLATDGAGRASVTLAGHGGGAAQYVLQGLVAEPGGGFVGGTTAAFY
jgi:hypothetical protein